MPFSTHFTVVKILDQYAIQRTMFGCLKTYLDLDTASWCSRSDTFFEDCLGSKEAIEKAWARRIAPLGEVNSLALD